MVKWNAYDAITTYCTLKDTCLQILQGWDEHDGLIGRDGDKGYCCQQGQSGPKVLV